MYCTSWATEQQAACYITVGGNTSAFWVDSRGFLHCETRLRGYHESSLLWCHGVWVTRGKARADLRDLCLCVMPVHVDCVREQGAVGLTGVWPKNTIGRWESGVKMSVGPREDPQLFIQKQHLFWQRWTIKLLLNLIRLIVNYSVSVFTVNCVTRAPGLPAVLSSF